MENAISIKSQVQANLVNQTEKSASDDYRDNVPFPSEHTDESNGAQPEREPIEHIPVWKENMNPEPDRQVQYDADHCCGHGGKRSC
jgi:hypothetical protein